MLYVAFNGSTNKSQIKSLMQENNILKSQAERTSKFFKEHQETALKYEEW